MTGLRSLVIITGWAALLSACAWMQTPHESDTFDFDWEIKEPTRTSHHAQLGLTDQGFWAYFPEDQRGFEPEWDLGSLVVLDADELTHFFAVVQSGQWGYRLQRLDDFPLEKTLTGDLRPITDVDVAQRDDLCWFDSVDEFPDQCGLTGSHRRWNLFDTTADDEVIRVLGNFDELRRQPGFPILRNGIAGGDLIHTWTEVVGATDEGRLLGIAAAPRVKTTLRATLVYDEACDLDLTGSVHVEALPRQIDQPIGDHPLAIEDAALRLSADAIVDCPGGAPRLVVPALSRPLLRGDDGRAFAPPTLGLHPRSMTQIPGQALNDWTRAAALIAAGDTHGASFWISQLAQREDISGQEEDLLLAVLPVIASAGQPELAIRLGDRLTSSAWNPENVPDYLDSLIVLLDHFGDYDDYAERVKNRQTLVKRRLDDHRAGWYRWADIRLRMEQRRGTYGPAYREIIAELEDDDLEDWALAIYATLQMHGLQLPVVNEPADLLRRFQSAGAGSLWTYLITTDEAAPCGDEEAHRCRPGPYGWNSGDSLDQDSLTPRLQSTPVLAMRRGFRLESLEGRAPLASTPSARAAFWLAAAPLVSDADLPVVTDNIVAALAEEMNGDDAPLCGELPIWQAHFEASAARVRAPYLDRPRQQWVNFIEWWSDHGLAALCDEPEALLDAVAIQARQSNRWTVSLFPLVQDRILASPEVVTNTAIFERSAELAKELGDEETCANWNLGISVAAARVGLFDAAESHLITANNCLSSNSPLRSTLNLVAAYLDFERAAGQNLITDGGIENALARATRRRIDDTDICVGLLPIGFHLESQLPQKLVAVADRIHLEAAPRDAYGLQTASHFVDEARAAYLTGIRDLARGNLLSAARALDLARSNFRRVQHLPGLARIAFLDDLIFDGQIAAIVDAEELDLPDAATTEIAGLRRGDFQALLTDGEDIEEDPEWVAAVIAALLIERREDLVVDRFGHIELPASLCGGHDL